MANIVDPFAKPAASGIVDPFESGTGQPVLSAAPTPERGYSAAFASGVPEALWGVWGKGLALAASVPAMGVDKLTGMVTGKETTAAQDWMFKNTVDAAAQKAQQYALTPDEAANTGKSVLHSLGAMVPTLASAVVTRGLVGKEALATQAAALQGATVMAPAAVVTGASSAATKVDQGTDLGTAATIGAIDTGATLLGGALPASAVGSLGMRAATGAGLNVATGQAQRLAQNAALDERPDLQRGFDVKDAAVDAIMGAIFGGVFGQRPDKTQISNAKAETDQLLRQGNESAQTRAAQLADEEAGQPEVTPAMPQRPRPPAPPTAEQLAANEAILAADAEQTELAPAPVQPARGSLLQQALAQAQAEIANTKARWGATRSTLDRAAVLAEEEAGAPEAVPAMPQRPRPAPTPAAPEAPRAAPPSPEQLAVMDAALVADAEQTDLALPAAQVAERTAARQRWQTQAEATAARLAAQAEAKATGQQVALAQSNAPVPTAMELAMQRAREGAAKTRAFTQAEAEAQRTKEAELDALQNIAKGEQLAQAVETGVMPPTETLALPRTSYLSATDALLAEAKAPGLKQEVAKAVEGKKTQAEQVAALQALQDGIKNKATNKYEHLGRLIAQFTEAKVPDEAPTPQAPEALAPRAPGEAPPAAAVPHDPAAAGAAAPPAPVDAVTQARIQAEADDAAPLGVATVADLAARVQAETQPAAPAAAAPVARTQKTARAAPVAAAPAPAAVPATPAPLPEPVKAVVEQARQGGTVAEAQAAVQQVAATTPDPVEGALNALRAAYGNEQDAMQAARRVQEQARMASPTGKVDPAVMIQMAHEDAAHRISKMFEAAEEAQAAPPRNPALDPERAAVMESVSKAQATLNGLADEYARRLAAREEMPESEHERYAGAVEVAQALQRELNRSGAPASAAFLKDLASFADDYATPEAWAKSSDAWKSQAASSADAISKPLTALMRQKRPLHDLLAFLETGGSDPSVRALAAKLREFALPTQAGVQDLPAGLPKGSVAAYSETLNEIRVRPGYVTESNLLHEGVHAATQRVIEQIEAGGKPATQSAAAQRKAYDGLEAIRTEALRRATVEDHYGLTDIHEFLAELNTNAGFREFLNAKGLWQRVVESVRNLLGLPVEARTALDKALALQDDLFSQRAYAEATQAKADAAAFDKSYAAAGEVTDRVMAKVVSQADAEAKIMNFGRATTRAVLQRLLNFQTKQYIANRTLAVPEFRTVGLADGVQAMYQTDLNRTDANRFTARAAEKFSGDLHKALHEIPAAQRSAANDMAGRVAVGASIGGFDPWMNWKDNLAAHPTLDPQLETQVNQTHRDFAALKKAHPALAEAILDGAKANRHDYVASTSVIVDNLLRRAGGADAAFAQPFAGRLDFMAGDVQKARNSDPARFSDGASAELNARLTQVFQQAAALPKDSTLRVQLMELGRVYTQQLDNSYYHAGRSGDYFVNVGFKDMDDATWAAMDKALDGSGRALGSYAGQDHIFMKVETLAQAEGLRRKLTTAGGVKIDEARNRHGKWATEGRLDNNAGISAALRAVLDTLHDSVAEAGVAGPQAEAMRDLMTRKFLSMMPESSVKTAKLHRVGVPGFDTDFLGTFAKHAASSTRDTANLYTMRAYTDAINAMTNGVAKLSEMPDGEFQARGQMVRDEMLKRYNNSMKTVDSGAVNVINSLGHSFYLAMSPAFFIRTMAQPYHRGLPYLGSRYGFVNSAKEIGGATGVAIQLIKNSVIDGWKQDGVAGALNAGLKIDELGLNPAETAFMKEMESRGVFDLGQARQLQRMAIDGSPRMQNATRLASMSAQYAEQVNRIATGLAAFRLAQKAKPGVAGDQITAGHANYADAAIKYIMDDFSPDNTARAIGKHGMFGKVTPLATAFMNYNLQTMQQIARTVQDGMFGHDKSPEGLQRAAEARREFAGLMGTTAMIAGGLGLPFANVFAGVYNTLFDDENDPHDIRVDARNWLKDTFGATVGEVVAHGPLQALTGIESSSFGMQNLLPGSEFLSSRRLLQDRLDELPKTLMGPALNAGLDIAAGAVKISEGHIIKGLGQMLPSGLKGYWKAGELAAHGHTDSRGNPIALEATPWDIAVQATGLRPASRAEAAEATEAVNSRQARLNQRKASLTDQAYKAMIYDGDVGGALDGVVEFNSTNPLQRIGSLSSMAKTRMRQEALGALTGGVNVPNKRLLPEYLEVTRFNQRGGGMP